MSSRTLPTPALSSHAVHVWTVPLGAAAKTLSGLSDLLSGDEHDRARRFHFERDAQRFMATRGAVRSVLAAYTQTAARDLRFRYSPQGKPSLAEPECDIRFNVSHSGELAVLAITREREIGIDIEYMKKDVETDKLAERFFSASERDRLRGLPQAQKVAGFFRCWTCKEAFLKAQGTGLFRDLSSFDVELNAEQPARLLATRPDADEANRWSVRELDTTEGYAAAVAVEGIIAELSKVEYPS
jgi:4'-phosphopantetheinyl transferase